MENENKPLSGLRLAIHAAHPDQSNLEEIASGLGAELVQQENEASDVFIADTVNSDACMARLKQTPKPAIVRAQWLLQCQRTMSKVPLEPQWILDPLEGMLISLTGFQSPSDRELLPKLLLALGAKYTPDLVKTCTHLVAKVAGGAKYKYAKTWGTVKIVSRAWLNDCQRLGCRQPESLYNLESGSQAQPTASKSQHNQVQPTTSEQSVVRPPAAKSVGAFPGPVVATSSSYQVPPSIADADDDCYFLDWVRLHLVGFSQQDLADLVKLVCESGATREPELHKDITHILVGPTASIHQLQAVREHMEEWREHVQVLRPQWLHECVVQRCHVEPNISCVLKPTDFPASKASNSMLGAGQPLNATSYVGGVLQPSLHMLQPTGSCSVDVSFTDGVSWSSNPGASRLDGEPGDVFKGLWFTLTAVVGSAEELEAATLIRNNGGYIFTSLNISKVRDISKAYAVCPHGLPERSASELEKYHEDFRAVPMKQRITVYWLQTSVDTGDLRPLVRGAPAFSPLPFQLPLKSFADVKIHVTTYSKEIKAAITKICTILGGTVTDNLSRQNTHLITSVASGDKYRMATKRIHIHTVIANWVIESAYSGKPLNALDFGPKPPEDADPGATQDGVASTSMMPSQLPGTQAAIALAGSRKSMSDGLGALPSQMPSSAPKLSFDNGGFCVTNPAAPILPPGPSSSIPAPPLRIGLPPMPGSNAHRQQQQQLNKAPSAKGESRLELSLQSLADPNRRELAPASSGPMPPPSTTTQPRVSPSASAPNLGEGGPAERRSSGGGGASTSRNIPPPRGEAAAQGGGHLDTLQVAPRSLNMPSFVGRSASASGGGSGKGNEMGAAVASATPAVEGTAGSGSGGPNPAAGASHPGKAGGSRTSHGDPAELSGENPDKFAEGVAAGADEEGADEVPAEGDGSGRGEGSQKSSAQEAGSKPDESDPYHMNLHLEINQLISKNNLNKSQKSRMSAAAMGATQIDPCMMMMPPPNAPTHAQASGSKNPSPGEAGATANAASRGGVRRGQKRSVGAGDTGGADADTRKSRRRRNSAEEEEDSGAETVPLMSQQVGYDLGQKPAERLTRGKLRSAVKGSQATAGHGVSGTHQGAGSGGSGTAAFKKMMINRIQSHGAQGGENKKPNRHVDTLESLMMMGDAP